MDSGSEQEDGAFLSSEGDETVTLSEIVAGREGYLREEELWALCRECCLTLEFVHSTQELFQSLAITPETVAFDREGNVCFLDLDADPDPLYIPPEVAENGCTYEYDQSDPSSHLFSLGMTLLYAVEYSSGNEDSREPKSDFSEDLNSLLTHLTQDDPEERPSVELVLELCERALQDASSQEICQNFACVTDGRSPQEEGSSSLQSVTEELAAYLQNQSGLVINNESDSSKTHSSATSHGSSAADTRLASQAERDRGSSRTVGQAEDGKAEVLAAGTDGGKLKGEKPSSMSSSQQQASLSPDMEGPNSLGDDSSVATLRRGRRKQGLLLSDILDQLDRYLHEAELWALCRESILSLQRKKKHLPAYISLDTLMVRENGCVSYKAIPEDKPLEVMYMAPELQQKGILNEKTCMYGLGVTVRCAAGQKYSSPPLEINVGAAFEELLSTLLQSKPDHRPSLETALLVCEEYEKQSSIDSRAMLQEMYMDASALMTGREQKKSNLLSSEVEDYSIHTATELQTSWTELDEMEHDAVLLEEEVTDSVEPASESTPAVSSGLSAFKPITPDPPPTGSAFKPVPAKPKPLPKPDRLQSSSGQQYPTAFSSSATHFKPIILHKSESVDAHVDRVAEPEKDDKEKNVVKKLKEIKKNLLKHRPPGSLSKDVETDDSKPPIPVQDQSQTPKGPRSTEGSRKNSGAGDTAGTLEVLLQQWQSSGNMPETQNLALAIAQHLQAQLGGGGLAGLGSVIQPPPLPQSQPNQASAVSVPDSMPVVSNAGVQNLPVNTLQSASSCSSQMHFSSSKSIPPFQSGTAAQPLYSNAQSLSSSVHPTGTTFIQSQQFQLDSGPQSLPETPWEYQSVTQASPHQQQQINPNILPQLHGAMQSMNFPVVSQGLSFPSVSQTGYYGQTPVSMPMMQFGGGGIMSGSVQYQLQQDPRTGLVQLVPLSVVPYGAQPPPSRSPHTLTSDQGFVWQQPFPVSPVGGYMSDPQTTDYSAGPATDSAEGSLHRVPSKPSLMGRNAKGLIQKTAAQRAKNTASASASPTGYHSDSNLNPENLSLCHPISDLDDDTRFSHGDDKRHKQRRSRTVGSEFMKNETRTGNFQGEYQHSHDRQLIESSHATNKINISQPYRTNSQSSSPSPSKDSGICLTGNGGAPHVTEASLMERLLSSDSLRHQQSLARVLQILHKGLAHGGQLLDSFQSEEVIAEYVVSLAHLKWETFMSAITEKYTEIHWQHPLLVNLYHAVNGQPPPVTQSSAKTPPATKSKTFVYNDQFVAEQGSQGNSHNRQQSEPTFYAVHDDNGDSPPVHHSKGSVECEWTCSSAEQEQHMSRSGGRFHYGMDGECQDGGGGSGPSVVRVLSNGRYTSGPSETSDSTDNESQEKRRRFKKRYELDRNKSSSMHVLPGNGNVLLSPEGVSSAGNVSDLPNDRLQGDLPNDKLQELNRSNNEPSRNMFSDKPSYSEQTKDRRDVDIYADHSYRSATNSPSSGAYMPSSYNSLPRQSRPQHSHGTQHQKSHDHWQGVPSPIYSTATSSSRQSSLPGSADTSTPANSTAPPRHEARELYHRQPRGPQGVYPQGNNRSPNLNNSGTGSNNSYSPALSRKGDMDSVPAYTQQQQAKIFTQGNVESGDSYSRHPRDSEGRFSISRHPNPSLNQNRDTSYSLSLSLSREGETSNNTKLHKPPTQPSRQLSPSNPEVNNNTHKTSPNAGSICSTVTSPKMPDGSPSRRAQHSAKPRLAWGQEMGEYKKKGQVVYHSAMIQLNMTPEIDRFIHEIDEDNKATIESRLASVEQEITVQRRQRKKSQAFYKKLTEPGSKQPKGEKGVVSQVLKDMSEMTNKLRYLDLCRTHLQMLLAELYGLDTCFLHTLVSSGGGGVHDPQPLYLQPFLENQLLQFHSVRERTTGCEVQVLQAGHPHGLLAYLFTLSALSDGYIHQFLFCFRYFIKADEVFNFITQKYLAATKGNLSDVNIVRVQQRAMDLLHFWVEGFYSVDFERNEPLSDKLETFVMQRVEGGVAGAQNLLNLVKACHLGENTELVEQPDSIDDQDEVYYLHLAAPKRWESFRSLLGHKKEGGKAPPSKESPAVPYKDGGGVMVEKRPPSRAESGSTLSLPRRSDAAQLMDYAPHRLAEQLTLMEQELFQRTHPVHYLDSKAQGVGVDMSIPSLRTPSMARKRENTGQSSLFVGPQHFESRVSDMIAHAQEITHWVSAEILSSGSQKAQIAILGKFLTTAQLCVEIRNFATALAIVAGLDNLLVRQLPAWKHLPARSAVIMEELESLQVQLKGEQTALMRDKESHIYPTVPCTLYFLLHLQQLEIGSFTLANGMYKWAKMRSICQIVDQIRIFREHEYGFEPDYELQSLIHRRLHELSDRDLHTVAAAHDNNFRRVTSGSTIGFQGTWRKVKVKLQSRNK